MLTCLITHNNNLIKNITGSNDSIKLDDIKCNFIEVLLAEFYLVRKKKHFLALKTKIKSVNKPAIFRKLLHVTEI